MYLIDLDNVEFIKCEGNKEFNHGVDCCINKLLEQERVAAIPMDVINSVKKELARKITKYSGSGEEVIQSYCDGFKDSLGILNVALEELEESEN